MHTAYIEITVKTKKMARPKRKTKSYLQKSPLQMIQNYKRKPVMKICQNNDKISFMEKGENESEERAHTHCFTEDESNVL